MDTLSYEAISVNGETAQKEWVIVDTINQIVGRLYSKVAKLLRGKYKPALTPHVDCEDSVIIIDTEEIKFSGKKETGKLYTHYTDYLDRQRFNAPAELRTRKNGVDKIVRHVVKGMLPKGSLRRSLLSNLYVFEGVKHSKATQKPKAIDTNQYK